MSDSANITAPGDFDRVQRLAGTAVVVGVVPWVLAAMLHAGRLVLSDGGLGLGVALREMFAPPILLLPLVAVLVFAAADRAVSSVGVGPAARALIVASAVCATVMGVLLLAGLMTFGANGFGFYVRLTAYLPLVAVAAGVRAS